MKKKVTKSFSIFSETGKELIEVARKYCNFSFDRKYIVTIGGTNYEFFMNSEKDVITISRFIKHRKYEKINT